MGFNLNEIKIYATVDFQHFGKYNEQNEKRKLQIKWNELHAIWLRVWAETIRLTGKRQARAQEKHFVGLRIPEAEKLTY